MAAGIEDITDDDLGNGTSTDDVKIDDKELDPEFLAGLAKDGKTPEEIAAEEQAAAKAVADKVEADKLAAEKLVEEQEAEKKGFVPKGRFNEINEEKKAALERAAAIEAENKALKAELEAAKGGKKEDPAPDPLDLMEDKVVELQLACQEALTDYGFDSEEYRASVKDYNRGNRELMRMEAAANSAQAVINLRGEDAVKAAIQTELNDVAEAAYVVYPFLDKNAETFDNDAISDVLEYRNELIETGRFTAAQALQKAIDKLAPFHAARIGAVKPPEDDDLTKARTVKEAREKAAREKAAAATLHQPAIPNGRAVDDSFKPEIDKLTPKEVGAMSEEQLAVLLGNA